MPAGSLLALIDDIASVLDDVAVLTKLATKKTAGVLGDDLAVNAEQVAGVRADRELPVVWAVAKGSAVNKAILVPAALTISAFAPWLVTPLLMFGGAFLCFEGFEKVAHKLHHSADAKAEDAEHRAKLTAAVTDPSIDLVALEKDKIKGAVRTDFILSAEIVAIALGTVASAPFVTQVAVLVGLSALMTVGVYGLVAGIVKLDDLGLYLSRSQPGESPGLRASIGLGIIKVTPYLMKALGVAGTLAMFLVGGGILTHGVHAIGVWIEGLAAQSGAFSAVVPMLANLIVGVLVGGLVLSIVTLVKRLRGK